MAHNYGSVRTLSRSAPNYVPLVILGAGRSGTNMLRDALVALPGFSTWNCDEINPVWRTGQPHDAPDDFAAGDLTARARQTIRRSFDGVARRAPGTRFVVEKTCANSLRPGFVDAALDDARFIQIVRDGRDVVPSAMKRWRGELEVNPRAYFLAKARHTPLRELPRYGAAFFGRRLSKLFGRSDRLTKWGPIYSRLDHDPSRPLSAICAEQWAACVDRTDEYLETLPAHRWIRVRYEDLGHAPAAELRRIADFLNAGVDEAGIRRAAQGIRGAKAGQGLLKLPPLERARALEIMAAPLSRHGYLGETQ